MQDPEIQMSDEKLRALLCFATPSRTFSICLRRSLTHYPLQLRSGTPAQMIQTPFLHLVAKGTASLAEQQSKSIRSHRGGQEGIFIRDRGIHPKREQNHWRT